MPQEPETPVSVDGASLVDRGLACDRETATYSRSGDGRLSIPTAAGDRIEPRISYAHPASVRDIVNQGRKCFSTAILFVSAIL